MLISILVAFVILFGVIIGAATLGMRYFDARRNKQVSDMLNSAPGDQTETPTGMLLMDAEDGPRSSVERVFSELDVARKLDVLILQAGMDWTPRRFLLQSFIFMVIGIV